MNYKQWKVWIWYSDCMSWWLLYALVLFMIHGIFFTDTDESMHWCIWQHNAWLMILDISDKKYLAQSEHTRKGNKLSNTIGWYTMDILLQKLQAPFLQVRSVFLGFMRVELRKLRKIFIVFKIYSMHSYQYLLHQWRIINNASGTKNIEKIIATLRYGMSNIDSKDM